MPPSNWKGANLVTHELHIRKKKKKKKTHPTLEMKLHLSPEHLISVFQRGGQTGAWLFGAEPSHPGNTAGVTVPPASPPGVPVVQDREGWTSAMSGDVYPVPGHWLEELARDWVCKGHGYYQISIRSSYGQVRVQVHSHGCTWGRLCVAVGVSVPRGSVTTWA